MAVVYNEFESYPAQWLRNLIKKGLLADGEVDGRSIVDVGADDYRGFTQVHLFAGLGGWGYAARLAGWPDDRPLFTGSCPCQPYSVAGRGKGRADDRDLWPEMFRLIAGIRPDTVMGEQVSAAIGKNWLDRVYSDLERIGYASGALVIPACAVDAPHKRERLWFVAHSKCGKFRTERHAKDAGSQTGMSRAARQWEWIWAHSRSNDRRHVANAQSQRRNGCASASDQTRWRGFENGGRIHVADPYSARSPLRISFGSNARQERAAALGNGGGRHVGDTQSHRWVQRRTECEFQRRGSAVAVSSLPQPNFWSDYAWIVGADGKARRVEPRVRRLDDGVSTGMVGVRSNGESCEITPLLARDVSQRISKLKALGNAIVPQVAAEIMKAWMDCRP